MSEDRARYDGDEDHLDEIVIHNATVHIEAMDSHNFMVMITRGTEPYEVYAHFNVQNLTESDDMVGVPYEIGPPLSICGEWYDQESVRHQCTERAAEPGHKKHRCDCGATNKKVSQS